MLNQIFGSENRGLWLEDHGLSKIETIENKFYNGHLYYTEESFQRIKDYKKILLYRDPRDYVVSYAHFFNSNGRLGIGIDDFFKENHYSIQEIMIDVIRGINVNKNILLGVGAMYERMHLKWRSENSLPIKYEDLIGTVSGGSDDVRAATIRKILHWLNIEPPSDIMEKIQIGSEPTIERERPSFRKGVKGEWKNEFMEYHKLLFKHYAPNLVSLLEYATDDNW